MAEFGRLETITLQAAADLSAKQYHVMRASAAAACNQASDAVNQGVIGVLQNKPISGAFATLGIFGKTKIVAGGAITVNALITTNSSGRAAAAASGQMVIGRALEASGADGQVITALVGMPWSLPL